nr:MAG TPA: hypothetical protein [Caudoviricetes sp.]
MKEKDTPMPFVRQWSIGNVYDRLDDLAARKISGESNWPDYCPLPLNIAVDEVRRISNEWDSFDAFSRNGFVSVTTACWAWSKTKVMYQFDPDLARLLMQQAEEMNESDLLPVEMLLNLPYPCIYMKTAGPTDKYIIDGLFAFVDYNTETKNTVIHFVGVKQGDTAIFDCFLKLQPGKTIWECIVDTMDTMETKGRHEEKKNWIMHLQAIQWILYLVSENAEITSGPAPEPDNTQKSQKGKKKKSSVKVKNVGLRIGAAIRKNKAKPSPSAETEPGTGSKKSPHSRRGHWHHYWTGPRDGDRKLILKWVAPTFINLKNKTQDTVVVYPVKMRKEEKQ